MGTDGCQRISADGHGLARMAVNGLARMGADGARMGADGCPYEDASQSTDWARMGRGLNGGGTDGQNLCLDWSNLQDWTNLAASRGRKETCPP